MIPYNDDGADKWSIRHFGFYFVVCHFLHFVLGQAGLYAALIAFIASVVHEGFDEAYHRSPLMHNTFVSKWLLDPRGFSVLDVIYSLWGVCCAYVIQVIIGYAF